MCSWGHDSWGGDGWVGGSFGVVTVGAMTARVMRLDGGDSKGMDSWLDYSWVWLVAVPFGKLI